MRNQHSLNDKKNGKQNAKDPQVETGQKISARLSRRGFLLGAGAAVTAAGASSLLAGCEMPQAPAAFRAPAAPSDPNGITTMPTAIGGPQTQFFVCSPEHAEGQPLEFFRPHEARTVEAITARILPGDEDDPGAREAGVVYYIDCKLASGLGYAEPTYREPPYAMGYDEDDPPTEEELAESFGVIWLPNDQLERYGYQSIVTPREAYRIGLEALDRYANDEFGDDFVDLNEEDQDAVVEALAEGEAEGFDDPSAEDFFEMLREDTIEGMFCDPIYGGNRNLVGWRMVGYPGAQRGYTPIDMHDEGYTREPQSLLSLHHYHPGQTGEPNPIFPIQGSEQ